MCYMCINNTIRAWVRFVFLWDWWTARFKVVLLPASSVNKGVVETMTTLTMGRGLHIYTLRKNQSTRTDTHHGTCYTSIFRGV